MKKLLLLIIAVGIMPLAHGMSEEASEPETKKLKTTVPQPPALPLAPELQPERVEQIMGDYAGWLETQDLSPVTLQSSDGHDFQIPFSMVRQSKTLDYLIEASGIDNPIPLPTIDAQTLAIIVKLMEIVDRFRMMQEQDAFLYIPRALQSVLNQILAKAPVELLIKLLAAANYLDIPFIMNGVAAVIANRIPTQQLQDAVALLWQAGPKDAQKEQAIKNAQVLLIEHKMLGTLNLVPKPARAWILKHLAHRKCGIAQEYSVADYLREHGQPELYTMTPGPGEDEENGIELRGLGLTSLYGISLLHLQDKPALLAIHDNCCLHDLSLDPQPAQSPFAGYRNLQTLSLWKNKITHLQPELFSGLKVKELDLESNMLKSLPANTFAGTRGIKKLTLTMNNLSHLDETTFADLPELEKLRLDHNLLSRIPIEALSNLPNLRKLILGGNPLSDEEKERIRVELPADIEIDFET